MVLLLGDLFGQKLDEDSTLWAHSTASWQDQWCEVSLFNLYDSAIVLRLLIVLVKPVNYGRLFLLITRSVEVCNLYIKKCSLHRHPEPSGTYIWSCPWACDGRLQRPNSLLGRTFWKITIHQRVRLWYWFWTFSSYELNWILCHLSTNLFNKENSIFTWHL